MRGHWKKAAVWLIWFVVLFIGAGLVKNYPNQSMAPSTTPGNIEETMNLIRPSQPPPLPNTLLVILVTFMIPPLPLIHQWLLAQVYRYAFQPGEYMGWNRLSSAVTVIISACAGVAIAFWLANRNITFIGIVAPMTLLCLICGVAGAVWIARKREFSQQFTVRLSIAAGLVSLIVPFGVVGVYITWPIVLAGVMAYIHFRREVELRIEQSYEGLTRWQVDSLVLGLVGIALFGVVACTFVMFVPGRMLSGSAIQAIGIGLVILELLLFSQFASILTRYRLRDLAAKKKNTTADSGAVSKPERYFGVWLAAAFVWLCSAFTVAVCAFGGQTFAYTYFLFILQR